MRKRLHNGTGELSSLHGAGLRREVIIALVGLALLPLASCTEGTITGQLPAASPVINSFAAAPASIDAGQSSTLSWSVTGATSLTISPGPGDVTGTTSATVSPSTTTVYSLAAVNDAGTTTATATVAVTTSVIVVAISPATASVTTGQQLTFSATVTGSSNTALTWSVQGTGCGSITAGGVYTAPGTVPAGSCAVVATSQADTSKRGTAAITLSCVPATSCAQGTNCGSSSDGCGGTVICGGSCTGGQTCGAVTPNICGLPPSTVLRPTYNTGNGFFVLNGKLYDANGNEFHIRGVNRCHWDSGSAAGILESGANAERWAIDFTRAASTNVSLIRTESINNSNVPIVGNWDGTCGSDPAELSTIVSTWVAQAAQWTAIDKYLIVNVANEWGPSDSMTWRDSYISAIASLRTAGYLGTILIDSGGCGQDEADLLQYSQAVFESDAQRNVMFAIHLYGGASDYAASIQSVTKGSSSTVVTLNSNSPNHPFAPGYPSTTSNTYSGVSAYNFSGVQGMTQLNGRQPALTNIGGTPGAWTVTLTVNSSSWGNYTGGGTAVDYDGNYALQIARLAALSQSTGAVYIIGEFGPGKNIGPSPTMVTPGEILTAAEANAIGWLAWAWDDNNLPNAQADDSWFSMTYSAGVYTVPADLTIFGQDVVLNPTYGISALATPATIF